MIACLAGAAGIAIIIFTVVFVYLRSRNRFDYLKKSANKKAPFNANGKLYFVILRARFSLTDSPISEKNNMALYFSQE